MWEHREENGAKKCQTRRIVDKKNEISLSTFVKKDRK